MQNCPIFSNVAKSPKCLFIIVTKTVCYIFKTQKNIFSTKVCTLQLNTAFLQEDALKYKIMRELLNV